MFLSNRNTIMSNVWIRSLSPNFGFQSYSVNNWICVY